VSTTYTWAAARFVQYVQLHVVISSSSGGGAIILNSTALQWQEPWYVCSVNEPRVWNVGLSWVRTGGVIASQDGEWAWIQPTVGSLLLSQDWDLSLVLRLTN